jgi:hypothetical protein
VLRPPSSVAHGAADVPHVNGTAADSSTSSCAASYAAAYAAADPSLMFEDDCGGIYSDPEYTEALVAVATIKQHGLRALDPEQVKRLVLKHVRTCDNKGNNACPTCKKLRERIRQIRAQKQQVSALPCLPLLEDARYVAPQPRYNPACPSISHLTLSRRTHRLQVRLRWRPTKLQLRHHRGVRPRHPSDRWRRSCSKGRPRSVPSNVQRSQRPEQRTDPRAGGSAEGPESGVSWEQPRCG